MAIPASRIVAYAKSNAEVEHYRNTCTRQESTTHTKLLQMVDNSKKLTIERRVVASGVAYVQWTARYDTMEETTYTGEFIAFEDYAHQGDLKRKFCLIKETEEGLSWLVRLSILRMVDGPPQRHDDSFTTHRHPLKKRKV